MTLSKQIFYLVITIGTFCRCVSISNISSFQTEVLEPSLYSFDTKYRDVAIINRSVSLDCDSTYNKTYYDDLEKKYPANYDSIHSNTCVTTLLENVLETNHFDTLKILPPNCKVSQTYTNNRFDKEELGLIRKYSDADLLVALNNFHSFSNEYYNKETGFLQIAHVVISHWSLYSLIDTSYMESRVVKDTISWDAYGVTYKAAKKKLPTVEGMVKESAQIIGEQFAHKLAPHWILVERLLYKSGNNDFKQADSYAKAFQWEQAKMIWEKYIDSENEYLSTKSKFNMAVASEMLGDVEKALEWVIKSYQSMKDNPDHAKVCFDYIDILNRRKFATKLLDVQIKLSDPDS